MSWWRRWLCRLWIRAPARAWVLGLPSPGSVVSGLLGGIKGVIGGTVGKVAVTAFDAIVHALFAPIARFINTQLLGWLVAVPDYARAGSHVAATEQTVLAMAGAALGAVATISVARFWAAGLAGSGGSALEGLARTVGAALVLPIWPWIFHTAVALANDASTGLLGSGSVTKSSANLLAVGVGAGVGLSFLGVGLFVSIVMAVVASVLFLGLLMMKVVLAISTVLVFVGMPIAIVLSPVVSWTPRVLARAFGGVSGGAVHLGGVLCRERRDAQRRLVPEGVLGVLRRVARAVGGDRDAVADVVVAEPAGADGDARRRGRQGRVRLARGELCRGLADTRRPHAQHMPGWAGGQGGSSDQRSRSTDSRLGARLSAESVLAASKAASAGGTAGATAAGSGGDAACPRRAGAARSNGAAGGSAESGSGWRQRVRGGSECAGVFAAADGEPAGGGGGEWRVAASELAPGGFRRGDARGVAARAARSRCPPSRPGRRSTRCRRARRARSEPGGRSWPAGAAAPGLPGARASGRRSSARRSAPWPPPAPRCAPRRSLMAAGRRPGFGESAEPATGRAWSVRCRLTCSDAGPAARPAMAGTGQRARTPQDQPRPDDGGGS